MAHREKILLVHLFSNGDCLYATTVARQIKNDFPACHLTWLIAGFCHHILDLNPHVDEVRVINDVGRSDVKAFRKLKRKLASEKKSGKWDEVFITHNMDSNIALYDGTIRGMILRAYPKPITVPIQPVLVLSDDEKKRVREFAEVNQLDQFRHVILWEYAPQSGQSALTLDFVRQVAEKITREPGTCVALSSANKFTGTDKIIDASVLTIRENAALTHYCTLLIGCSSGITWLSTSTGARQLPMLQLLDSRAYFRNAPSIDFDRYGIPAEELIELFSYNEEKVAAVITSIIKNGIQKTKTEFNEPVPLQFNTTRKVIYNLLCYMQFKAIARHYRITKNIYGRHPVFIRQFLLSFLNFPFKLIANTWKKR